MTLEQLADRLIEREAGYVDNPADKGGPTKFGITQRKLSAARNRPCSAADVEHLSVTEARAIYVRDLVDMGLDLAPEDARELFFDIVENHGPGNGVRILQRALGVAVDGVFGRVTRAALAAADGRALYRALVAERMQFTGRIISKNLKDDDHDGIPDNTEFAEGWLNRQSEFARRTP